MGAKITEWGTTRKMLNKYIKLNKTIKLNEIYVNCHEGKSVTKLKNRRLHLYSYDFI